MNRREFIRRRAVPTKLPRALSFIDSVLVLFPGHVEGDLKTLADELEDAGLTVRRDGPVDCWEVYGYVSMSLPAPWEGNVQPAIQHARETGSWELYDAITSRAQKKEDEELNDMTTKNKITKRTSIGYLARAEKLRAKIKK